MQSKTENSGVHLSSAPAYKADRNFWEAHSTCTAVQCWETYTWYLTVLGDRDFCSLSKWRESSMNDFRERNVRKECEQAFCDLARVMWFRLLFRKNRGFRPRDISREMNASDGDREVDMGLSTILPTIAETKEEIEVETNDEARYETDDGTDAETDDEIDNEINNKSAEATGPQDPSVDMRLALKTNATQLDQVWNCRFEVVMTQRTDDDNGCQSWVVEYQIEMIPRNVGEPFQLFDSEQMTRDCSRQLNQRSISESLLGHALGVPIVLLAFSVFLASWTSIAIIQRCWPDCVDE